MFHNKRELDIAWNLDNLYFSYGQHFQLCYIKNSMNCRSCSLLHIQYAVWCHMSSFGIKLKHQTKRLLATTIMREYLLYNEDDCKTLQL